MPISVRTLAALALSTCLGITCACAQDLTRKPIRVIIGFGAGSGTDVSTRVLTNRIAEATPLKFVIDNRPGAEGFIAAQEAARAPADGYTIYVAGNTTHAANPNLFKSIPYDPQRDYTPVTRLAMAPLVLVVSPRLEAKNLAELTEHARRNPGKVSFATGSASHRGAAELYKLAAKLSLVHVPYKSSPQALNDIAGGHVDFMFADTGVVMPYVRGGRVRALALTSLQRVDAAPDLPTMAESGYPGFEMTGWTGLFLPRGAPDDVVRALNRVFSDATRTDAAREFAKNSGAYYAPGTPEELAAWVKSEIEKWALIVKLAGIQPE